MKHLFVIQGHSAYLMAKLAMGYDSIPAKDCRFVFLRGMTPYPQEEVASIQIPFRVWPEYFVSRNDLLLTWKTVSEFDRMISECVGRERFCAYSYNFATRFNQLIFTHPLCCGRFLLEEGMLHYNEGSYLEGLYKEQLSFEERLKTFLNYGSRVAWSGVMSPRCDGVYCLHDLAFVGCDKKIVHDINAIREFYSGLDHSVPEGAVFVVLGADATFKMIPENVYADKFLRLITDLKDRASAIYLKYHPAQTVEERERFGSLLIRDGLSYVRVLPDNVPLEQYIFSSKKYCFVGSVSSILFYAALQQQEAYTIVDQFGSQKAGVEAINLSLFCDVVRGFYPKAELMV